MQGSSADERNDPDALVQYRVATFSDEWVLKTEWTSTPAWHDNTISLLKDVLRHWQASTGRDASVFRDLAVRVRQDLPSVGLSPDITLVEPAPPGASHLESLDLWEPGHAVPALAIEVVRPEDPNKDYARIPRECAALGIRELIVFDPLSAGPPVHGGPFLLAIWRRSEDGAFTRVACGEGPFRSELLGGYLVVMEQGMRLRIANGADGSDLWPTAVEAIRAERLVLRAETAAILARVAVLEEERRLREALAGGLPGDEKEAALARVADLEEQLRRLRS